ncbi:hypothetical protein [Amycolatopsis anabasis]|uniref:hypothetical protein n=1 Tax=Amycolatopsis anabasis TaxID=1840409 RepID=UPI00131CEC1D|nr:hypothetical protein [Amycolatopsis anabasis]
MTTIEPDPDTPDPADRTMQRLEMVTAFDEVFPQWRSYVAGECQREGVPLGWMGAETAAAGAVLAELGEGEQNPEAVPLIWHARRRYLILRTPEAPELWVRALPAFPVTYSVEALLLTREIESERGVRRWQLLTAAEDPVLLTDHSTGGRARPWLLRDDMSYDLEHDIEGGWKVFGHDTPDGTVPRPEG